MIPRFRAWDKHRQKMFANDQLIIWNGNVYANDSKMLTCNNLKGWSIDDEYLMLSTGIKDKAGNEIFEGDILITNAHASIVSFGEYTYFEDADTEVTEVGFYLSYLNVSPATYSPFEKFFWEKFQVIGNIHENELDLIMYEAWKFNEEMEDET